MTMNKTFLDSVKRQIGKPYSAQATGPDSFSCSGLVSYALRSVGWIGWNDHLTEEQLLARFHQYVVPETAVIHPGDILLFGPESTSVGDKNPLKHAAIAETESLMIESSNGGQDPGVRRRPIGACPQRLAFIIRLPL